MEPITPLTTARELPLLTLYRDGLTNLNGEATRLLGTATTLLLLPPTRACPRWVLVPDTVGAAGDIQLVGRADRGNRRFRAPGLALALFAALPDGATALRLQLEAAPLLGWKMVAQNLCNNKLELLPTSAPAVRNFEDAA